MKMMWEVTVIGQRTPAQRQINLALEDSSPISS